jgi:hypothetical protein
MAQPQPARITCKQCNAWYNSETELRNHMRTAHRVFISERSTQEGETQPDNSKIQETRTAGDASHRSPRIRTPDADD